jgi:hypothetical protein
MDRRAAYVERAQADLASWAERNGVPAALPLEAPLEVIAP